MFVTRLAQRNNVALLSFSRMGFSSHEYDLAVIGGGPGGKLIPINSQTSVISHSKANKCLRSLLY